MKNNIKKAPVRIWEDLLYFSAFYADFCLCPKLVNITTLSQWLLSCKATILCTVLPPDLIEVSKWFIHPGTQTEVIKVVSLCEFARKI